MKLIKNCNNLKVDDYILCLYPECNTEFLEKIIDITQKEENQMTYKSLIYHKKHRRWDKSKFYFSVELDYKYEIIYKLSKDEVLARLL